MREFILPTGGIFFEFRRFEPILCFRAEGVRGVIRDLVLLPVERKAREEDFEQFRREVLEEYDRAIDLRFWENTFSHQEYASWLVELLLEEVNQAVRDMFIEFFKNLDIEVDKKELKWLGVDLIARIHLR